MNDKTAVNKTLVEIFEKAGLKLSRTQKYKEYTLNSVYITMRDGIKIATDIYLPKGTPASEKLPAILIQSCYWRQKVFKRLFKWLKNAMMVFDFVKEFVSYGFAVVFTDVRGTGASFGTRPYPWAEEEIEDNRDIVDWIVAQPWSDGNVVTWGHSYLGTTAEFAGVVNHPAVKGLVPMHNEFDPYLDIVYPGGLYDYYFVDNWATYTLSLDQNNLKGLGFPWLALKSVKPVDSDERLEELKAAAKEHLLNANIAELAKEITYRDEKFRDTEASFYNFSVYRYIQEINQSNVPLFCWGSWRDAATSKAVIERFMNFNNPIICVIGAWTHAAYFDANPYLPPKKREPDPTYSEQVKLWVRFFEACLNQWKAPKKLIIYYTMMTGEWKATKSWPPKGQVREKWYFRESNSLSKSMPSSDSETDIYKVNFNATTGKKNRWYTEIGVPAVIYRDRAKQDKLLMVYDSDLLENDQEITGYPIVHLFLSSTHEDGAIFVYLEDVDDLGNAVHITEGELRLIHRKVSNEKKAYISIGPYHSYLKKDKLPMIPGEIAEITFSLIPTSVVIRKGHRIRLAIGGADKDTFSRYPDKGTPLLTISRNKNNPSYIELPIIR